MGKARRREREAETPGEWWARKMRSHRQTQIAFTAAGAAAMSTFGGAMFAYTQDMTVTMIALAASAAGLGVFGRRTLRWWWGKTTLGADIPGGPSAEYERTTRARKLAPKVLRMIEKAREPITVITTGVERPPREGAPDTWGAALRAAARAGASIRQYLPPRTSDGEVATAQALADEYPQCECIRIGEIADAGTGGFHPTLAWEGDVKRPRQALLWLEKAREPGEAGTAVEYRNTRNLRRNEGMLEEFARSLDGAGRPA